MSGTQSLTFLPLTFISLTVSEGKRTRIPPQKALLNNHRASGPNKTSFLCPPPPFRNRAYIPPQVATSHIPRTGETRITEVTRMLPHRRERGHGQPF